MKKAKLFITKRRVSQEIGEGVQIQLKMSGDFPKDSFWKNRLVDGDIEEVKQKIPKRTKLKDNIETKGGK